MNHTAVIAAATAIYGLEPSGLPNHRPSNERVEFNAVTAFILSEYCGLRADVIARLMNVLSCNAERMIRRGENMLEREAVLHPRAVAAFERIVNECELTHVEAWK